MEQTEMCPGPAAGPAVRLLNRLAGRAVVPALLLAALVGVLYASVLRDLVMDWWSDGDYSHGFVVPLFAAYVIWRDWDRYKKAALAPDNLGLLVMLGALAVLVLGTLGTDLFTSRFSLLILIAGMVLFLAGRSILRALAFPLAYLAFMIPLPAIVYNQITFPLQLIASRFAERAIALTGIPVLREGNMLSVPQYSVEVAQACSGIRSLLSLLALVVAYVYIAEERWWARVAMVVLMFPIAIFSNAFRIMGTCLVGYAFGPEWAEGFLHLFSGWLIFVLALGMMLLAHVLLGRIGNPGKAEQNA